MSAKQIDVQCPCCAARLTIDVLTAKVMRTERAEQPGDGKSKTDKWENAQAQVRERTAKSTDKLESALESERTKEARFEELFRKAKEKNFKPDEEA